MLRLDLTETDDWRPVTLTGEQANLLAASEVVDIRPATTRRWEVRARTKVGAVIVGPADGPRLDIRIQPKVPVDRLLFLMGYTTSGISWTPEGIELPEATDLPSTIAEALVRVTDRALDHGVIQGYRTLEEAGTVLRGRIRHREQIQRRFAEALPIEVTYDEYSPDIAENQILLAALMRASRIPGVPAATRGRLHRLSHRFEGVGRLVPGQPLPPWRPSRLNTRYQPALRLAELVLNQASFDLGRGHVPAAGFLVNMATVFEKFVERALGQALTTTYSGRITTQESHWLDAGKEVVLRPDLLWYPPGTQHPGLVADAKYKAEKPAGFPNADVYQLLAYCTALDLHHGHLVYAQGNEHGHTYQLPGVTIHAHTLDLDTEPAALLAQVTELAGRIAPRD